MSRFNQRPPALMLPVLAVIAAVLAFLWWRPMQRWALGIDELERRIEALERKTVIDLPRSSGFIPL
jgi:membrane protein implicated in regulation of membrane protease activity